MAATDRLQHQIAAKAAGFVAGVLKDGKDPKEYKSFCEGFPTLLRTAGLLQTLLFLEAKRAHPHGTLLTQLKDHFQALGLIEVNANLATTVATLGTSEYMTWTRMADKIAYWHKRFSQALLAEKKP